MNQIRTYRSVAALMAWALVTLGATALAAISAPYTERATAPFVEVWRSGPLALGDQQCADLTRLIPCTDRQ